MSAAQRWASTHLQTLRFLSLVFGGLPWPLVWLWAFTRPPYRAAYRTGKHNDLFIAAGEKARRGVLPPTGAESGTPAPKQQA
ncbi:hypothetical protein [Paraburkholderia gardini]|uniref:Uncharacterized protein n=1 Tax=Paraburkholderia gardini TaxID=2823469 RepID=A0ABM8U4L7_9BURK|nr:hypothetical protein [Paraburkholderia gardini]CAG4902364.1 hypothetical protein R54767_02846 [Paraburkholderia gardini]